MIIEKPDCEPCAKLKLVLTPIIARFSNNVSFVTLLVTDKGATKEAEKKAHELGIDWFLEDNSTVYPSVGIFTSKHRLSKEILGLRPEAAYVSAIERVLSK